jgi:phytanoyl-CoA hydroxylase
MAASGLKASEGFRLNSSELKAFHADGYLILRGVFGSAELKDLRRGCDDLEQIARERSEDFFIKSCYFNLHRDCDPYAANIKDFVPAKGLLRRVTYPYLVSEIFNLHRTHPALVCAVASVFGEQVVQITNQVNFNHPGRGTGWGWHQDYRFRKPGIENPAENFFQTLTAIDPCNASNGGLRLVPGSHRLGELALDLDVANAESKFDASRAITPDLQPGDVVFFKPHVIHGSTANRSSGPRRVFINGFANGLKSDHGIQVYRQGMIIKQATGIMEYEKNTSELPHASKF